jgi:NAD(P)-dependent dehydrogenase (short-subunit alcohol dehydrogenase family)
VKKRGVVTGGSRGLGLEVSRQLRNLSDRDLRNLAEREGFEPSKGF